MKKYLLILFIFIGSIMPAQANEQDIVPHKEVAIGNMTELTSLHGWLYIAEQPDEATLKSLKDLGFVTVINVRAADELKFDEKTIVEREGLHYYNIPLLKDGKIRDSAVEDIHHLVEANKGQKILLHCSSGNRAAAWLGAHLVRDMGLDKETAINIAQQAGMTKDSMAKILRDYLDMIVK